MEAELGVRTDLVEEIVRVLAAGVGADQCLAAVVEQGGLDAPFPDFHEGVAADTAAILPKGGLVEDHAMVAAASPGNRVLQRPEIQPAASHQAQDSPTPG